MLHSNQFHSTYTEHIVVLQISSYDFQWKNTNPYFQHDNNQYKQPIFLYSAVRNKVRNKLGKAPAKIPTIFDKNKLRNKLTTPNKQTQKRTPTYALLVCWGWISKGWLAPTAARWWFIDTLIWRFRDFFFFWGKEYVFQVKYKYKGHTRTHTLEATWRPAVLEKEQKEPW